MTVHCFSVDVEGSWEASAESISVPPEMVGSLEEQDEIRSNVFSILDFLDEYSVKGTFYCLGTIAQRQPDVVKRIADRGHEIASHGFWHLRLKDLDYGRAQESIVRSKQILEDVSGTSVVGFRAPDFSIDSRSMYLLDMIRGAGYLHDSSMYPIGGHDVYGIKGAIRHPHTLPNGLVEYPPATFSLAGKVLPALGGGYFRLYPLFVSRSILRSYDRSGEPAMLYIHPCELGGIVPVVPGISLYRKFRHFVNIKKCRPRYSNLFRTFKFGRAVDILNDLGLFYQGPANR